jgi:hypothetical protein
MTTSLGETFDFIAHTEVLEQRLAAASVELSTRPGLTDEKSWLEAARQTVARARNDIGDLLTRVLRLPELESMRGEHVRGLQGAAVDATEQLQAAIVAAGGERSPLIETLFRNTKTVLMRKCSREEFEKFYAELEKRIASSYAKRILADPSYEVLATDIERMRHAFSEWRNMFTSLSSADTEAQALRSELESVARRLELPCRQARLLAEAALLPAMEIYESSGILEKPKRRAARVARAVDAESTPAVKATAPAKSEPPSSAPDDES